MDELKTRLENLKSDLEFVRHSGALKEVEDYLTNEINTVNGALVACSAYEKASKFDLSRYVIDYPQLGMVL